MIDVPTSAGVYVERYIHEGTELKGPVLTEPPTKPKTRSSVIVVEDATKIDPPSSGGKVSVNKSRTLL